MHPWLTLYVVFLSGPATICYGLYKLRERDEDARTYGGLPR